MFCLNFVFWVTPAGILGWFVRFHGLWLDFAFVFTLILVVWVFVETCYAVGFSLLLRVLYALMIFVWIICDLLLLMV